MTRLSLTLLLLLVACALSAVTSQHRARQLFVELQKAQDQEKLLDIELGQLQLEQSTWSTSFRIESIATRTLHMRPPDSTQVRVINPRREVRAQVTP